MTIQTLPSERSGSEAPRDDSRRGSISIFSAITALLLVGVMGLGLDTALVMTARQQLQRTADAASLAAAAKVKLPGQTNYDLTRQAAIDTAAAMSNDIVRCGVAGIALDPNFANVDDDTNHVGDIVVGRWRFDSTLLHFVFQPTDPSTGIPVPDAVKVRAKCASGSLNSSLELIFGAIFGTNDSNVGRYAIARQGRRPDPLILILHRTQRGALTMNGGAHMDVLAGTIQVDSNHACAFVMNGTSGLMEAQSTRVVGGACIELPSNLLGDLITGAPYVPDPLINLPAPDPNSMLNLGGITGPGTYLPGYYPDGVNMNGGTAFLESGIYVIGNNGSARGIDLKGDAVLESKPGGVFIYTEPGAGVTTSGSASGLNLAPLLSGTYDGVTIFMARTGNAQANIGGGGVFEIRGTFYVPNGELVMHGDVRRTVGRIIVDTQTISGNAQYVITGDDVPPPTGPQFVYLVN